MLNFLALFLICFSTMTCAESRNEKIKQLMDAQGMTNTLSTYLEADKAQTKEASTKIMDQTMEKLFSRLKPSEEFKQRVITSSGNYIKKVESAWGHEKIVEVWAGLFGPEFTDAELDQLIKFYTSPLGQKDIRVTRSSSERFVKYLKEAAQPILTNATKEYVLEIKKIAQECKCEK